MTSSILSASESHGAKIQPASTPSVDIPIVNQNAVRSTRTRSAGSGESK